jgi:hypothetical protein
LSVVAPLTATAALLFISLRLSGPAPEAAREMALRDSHTPLVANARSEEGQPLAAKRADNAAHSPLLVGAATSASGRPENLDGAADEAAALRSNPSGEVAADKAKVEAATDGETSTQLAALVEGIQKSNDQGQIAVVRVSVVDRREGMELVQVILDKKHIPRDQTTAERRAATDAKSVAGQEPSAVVHEALFVVADVVELREALEALLAQKESAVAWKLDEPIDLHRLDRRSQQRVEEAMVALSASRLGGASAETASAKEELLNDKPLEKTAPPLPSAASANSKIALADVKSQGGRSAKSVAAPSARQLLVTLPDQSVATAAAVEGKEKPSAFAKEASPAVSKDVAASRRSLVRVLLLVEPQARPAVPGEPAPAEPGPGDGAI